MSLFETFKRKGPKEERPLYQRLVIDPEATVGARVTNLQEAIVIFYPGLRGLENDPNLMPNIFFEFIASLLEFNISTFSLSDTSIEEGRTVRIREYLKRKLSEASLNNYDEIRNNSKLKDRVGVIISEGRKRIRKFLEKRGEIKFKINWEDFKNLFQSKTGIDLSNLQIDGIKVSEEEIRKILGIKKEDDGFYLYVNPLTIIFGGDIVEKKIGEVFINLEDALNRPLTELPEQPPEQPPEPEALIASIIREYNGIVRNVARIQNNLRELRNRELSEATEQEYRHLTILWDQVRGLLVNIRTQIEQNINPPEAGVQDGQQRINNLNNILDNLRRQAPIFQALADRTEALLNMNDPQRKSKLKEAVKLTTNILSGFAVAGFLISLPIFNLLMIFTAGGLWAWNYIEKNIGLKK